MSSHERPGAALVCQRGRTLVELIVSLAIASIVIGMVTAAQARALHWLRIDQERLDIYRPIRDGADMLARDIRIASSTPVLGADCHSIRVPITEDGTVYVVEYTWDDTDGTLEREKQGQTKVVAENLTHFCATPAGNQVRIDMKVVQTHRYSPNDSVQEITLFLYPQMQRG